LPILRHLGKANILRKNRPVSDAQALAGLRLMEDVIFAQRIARFCNVARASWLRSIL
jgi:hypothetical protein